MLAAVWKKKDKKARGLIIAIFDYCVRSSNGIEQDKSWKCTLALICIFLQRSMQLLMVVLRHYWWR